MGGAQAVLIDAVEKVVQQPDAIESLDFNSGAGGVQIVADEGADRHGDAVVRAGFEEVDLTAKEFLGVVTLSHEDGLEGVEDALAGGCRGDGLEVGGADAEDVDDDFVGAGEEVGR